MNYYVCLKRSGWLILEDTSTRITPRKFSLEEAKLKVEELSKVEALAGEEFCILDESYKEVKYAEDDN